jgi:hypothetical protein
MIVFNGQRIVGVSRYRGGVSGSASASNSQNSATITGLSIVTGSAIYLYIQTFNTDAYPTSIVDSQGNTYYFISMDRQTSSDQFSYLYVCPSSSGPVSQVAVTLNTNAYLMTQIVEITNALSTRSWDSFNYTTFSSTTAWASNALTTNLNDEQILALGGTEEGRTYWNPPLSSGWSISQQLGDVPNGQAEFAAQFSQSMAGTTSVSLVSADSFYGSIYLVGSTATAPSVSSPTFVASILAVNSSFATPNNTITGASGGASSINTTGSSIFIAVAHARSSTPTLTDSENNTWAYGNVINVMDGGSASSIRVAYVLSPTTSSSHTFNPTGTAGSCEVFAFKGGSNWYLETQGQIYPHINSTTIPTQAILAFAGEILVVSFASDDGVLSATVNSSFNGGQGVSAGSALSNQLTGSAEVGASAYRITPSVGANTPTFTASTNNGDFISAAFAFRQA